MTRKKRPYRKKKRAEQQEKTRQRLVESAVHLHGTVGPANTPMAAVAEHAGVPRSTLYRYFPDEPALFDACSAHWAAQNPVPDPTSWMEMEEPEERLRKALGELYSFYRRNHRMLDNLFRDEPLNESVKRTFAGFRGYLDEVRRLLADGFHTDSGSEAALLGAAAAGHAVSFSTWRSLAVEQGLDDDQAVELMVTLVRSSARAQTA